MIAILSIRQARPVCTPCWFRTVSCKAEASVPPSRRQLLSAGAAGAASLLLTRQKAVALELFDHTQYKPSLDRLDQSRDDAANYKQARYFMQELNLLGPEEHAKRARESLDRLQRDIKASVDRKSWPRVTADLRHQMGTLRYDLDKLIAAKDKSARKEASKLEEAAMQALSDLDQSARYNGKGASENYEAAVKALSDVVSFLA
eukprot:jgi/Astpho2/8468/Aster-08367